MTEDVITRTYVDTAIKRPTRKAIVLRKREILAFLRAAVNSFDTEFSDYTVHQLSNSMFRIDRTGEHVDSYYNYRGEHLTYSVYMVHIVRGLKFSIWSTIPQYWTKLSPIICPFDNIDYGVIVDNLEKGVLMLDDVYCNKENITRTPRRVSIVKERVCYENSKQFCK